MLILLSVCVLMQAEEARLWFHVILVEERGEDSRVCLLEVVPCVSASCSAWCTCCSPAVSAGLVLLSPVSSGAKHLSVCGVGQYINLKEK